jgi:hypothetical protein
LWPEAVADRGEAAKADEAIGIVDVAEVAPDPRAALLLGADEVTHKEVDQGVVPTGFERVLAQFDDPGRLIHAGECRRGTGLW